MDITTGTKCRRSIHGQSNSYLNKCSPNTLLQRNQYIYILYYSQSIIGSQCVAQTAICSYITVQMYVYTVTRQYLFTKCTIYHTIIVLVCTIDKLLSTVHCTCKPAFALNGLFWLVNTKKDRPELWFRRCIYKFESIGVKPVIQPIRAKNIYKSSPF